ncbi:MAG: hypothetical protein DCC49_02595 [Acidobacteria bacterium]|nr:MAG: hypothetical protein DCC49_02595 [Acidobacteriota bacterium]
MEVLNHPWRARLVALVDPTPREPAPCHMGTQAVPHRIRLAGEEQPVLHQIRLAGELQVVPHRNHLAGEEWQVPHRNHLAGEERQVVGGLQTGCRGPVLSQ